MKIARSVEWYTPQWLASSATEVLEEIELDPASCNEANALIQAKQFYTEEEDGLSKEWWGKVWCNPPYHREGPGVWIAKMMEEFGAARMPEGMIIVNASTSAQWFHPLWRLTLCFLYKRVVFVDGEGNRSQPRHASAIAYMGQHPFAFARAFAHHGRIVLPASSP